HLDLSQLRQYQINSFCTWQTNINSQINNFPKVLWHNCWVATINLLDPVLPLVNLHSNHILPRLVMRLSHHWVPITSRSDLAMQRCLLVNLSTVLPRPSSGVVPPMASNSRMAPTEILLRLRMS